MQNDSQERDPRGFATFGALRFPQGTRIKAVRLQFSVHVQFVLQLADGTSATPPGVALVQSEYDKTLIEIAGHTDDIGSDDYNQSLSVRRATSVEEFRDRLLKLQGEVIAWKAHNLRLLTEAAQGVDSGVKRMIVKYGGTMLGFRLSSLAVDALGAAGLPFESAGEDAEDRRC